MRCVHSFVALLVVLVLATSVSAGDGKPKAKKEKTVSGRVTAVDKDKGTLTVKVQPKTKKGDTQTTPAEEKTFKVTETTKYSSVSGKKGALQATTATFDDIKVGVPVTISHTGDSATAITIQQGKTKKQK
ncbi:MAG TPA: hypothetical protein VFA18_12375 [Gemmataceae bacterium]|jgi:hypothetical protein|nr:hypothetical protein [Gemmataceae bacterium]